MHVEAFNGYPINRPLSSSVVLTCDASESGYGAHISFGGERRFCSGMWSFVERAKSSSFRELLAVDLALKSFQHFVIGKKVTIVSDNQNFVGIVHAGSSVTHLHQIAVDIFSFCMAIAACLFRPSGFPELTKSWPTIWVASSILMTECYILICSSWLHLRRFLLMLAGWCAVTIIICRVLILSFGVLVLRQWIVFPRI